MSASSNNITWDMIRNSYEIIQKFRLHLEYSGSVWNPFLI